MRSTIKSELAHNEQEEVIGTQKNNCTGSDYPCVNWCGRVKCINDKSEYEKE